VSDMGLDGVRGRGRLSPLEFVDLWNVHSKVYATKNGIGPAVVRAEMQRPGDPCIPFRNPLWDVGAGHCDKTV
jgi:hypothetical protein